MFNRKKKIKRKKKRRRNFWPRRRKRVKNQVMIIQIPTVEVAKTVTKTMKGRMTRAEALVRNQR